MDFTLPEAIAPLRQAARSWAEDVLRPLEGRLPSAEGGLPADVRAACLQAKREAGLWGLTVPAAEGGRGASWLAVAAAAGEAHRSLLGLWAHGLLAAGEPPEPLLAARGTQRERFLLPCLDGRREAHQVLAGPGVTVRRSAAGLRIDGVAAAVPAFQAADILVLAAPAGPAAILDPGLAGYRVVRRRPTMGSAELADLSFEGCAVDSERILPDAGPAALRWQAMQRAAILGAGAAGAAQRCLEDALDHVRSRHTFGQPLAERQAIQWMLADSARDLHAARLLVYRAAALADAGADPSAAAVRAKVFTTDAACRTVDRVLQMHGGYGYSRDLPFERYWRDLRYYRLAEGENAALCAGDADALLRELDA